MPKGIYERKWNPISNMGVRTPKPWQERFWPKVEKSDGCWLWVGAKDRKGYGKLQIGTLKNPKYVTASRLSYEIANGPIPPGRNVLHSCDTPPCVNPEHLFLGSYADNAADKVAKGRQSRGENHPWAKLTNDQVRELRAMDWTVMKPGAIARRYGISYFSLRKLLRGETYRDLL